MKIPGFAELIRSISLAATFHLTAALLAQVPPPLGVPQPGPTNGAPYAPQPILQGGIVVPLYPPGSPFLNVARVREAEQYNMNRAVPGRISSIVNIHNPSIEVHTVDGSLPFAEVTRSVEHVVLEILAGIRGQKVGK